MLVQLSISQSLSLSLSNITYTPCLTLVARCLLAVGAGICQVCLQCVALGPSQVESVHFSLESLICCPLLVAFSSSICRTCLCVCVCARSLISISRAYLDNYVSGLMRPRPLPSPALPRYHGQSLLSNSSFPISHFAFGICDLPNSRCSRI